MLDIETLFSGAAFLTNNRQLDLLTVNYLKVNFKLCVSTDEKNVRDNGFK